MLWINTKAFIDSQNWNYAYKANKLITTTNYLVVSFSADIVLYSQSLYVGISLNCNKQYSRSVTVLLVQTTIQIIY